MMSKWHRVKFANFSSCKGPRTQAIINGVLSEFRFFFRQSMHWTVVIPKAKVAYRWRNYYGCTYALKMHDFTRSVHSSMTVSPFSCLRRHTGTVRLTRGGEMKVRGRGDRQSLLLPQLRARRSQCKQTYCWQNEKRKDDEMAQRLREAR